MSVLLARISMVFGLLGGLAGLAAAVQANGASSLLGSQGIELMLMGLAPLLSILGALIVSRRTPVAWLEGMWSPEFAGALMLVSLFSVSVTVNAGLISAASLVLSAAGGVLALFSADYLRREGNLAPFNK